MGANAQAQTESEQHAVTEMFKRLDAEAAAARAELAGLPPDLAPTFARKLRDLRAAEAGLCFGRIDLADGTVLHIGRRGLRVDGEPLLVDWRAAAAVPFYAATPANPMGLRRRRHIRLDGRVVRGVADEILDGSAPRDGDVIGDGPLAEALSAHRTGWMRDAVTTLQAEQDAIVRSPSRGVTVVQGGPGTGKTVVALHRAAYVLFAHPPAARGVLVVGPDARFLDYISRVLPSLGEHDVRLATRQEVGGVDPAVADRLAAWVGARRPPVRPITLPLGSDQVELGADVVAEALAAARDLPHNPGREVFRDYLVAELTRERERRTAGQLARIDAETRAATGLDLDAAVAADLRSLGFADTAPAGDETFETGPAVVDDAVLDDIWPRLTPAAAVRGLPGVRGTAALLDEAAALLDGPPPEAYGHVVVDEAQELTEMDWRAVMRRCPSRSMTVVGDFAQAGAGSTVTSWRQALEPFVGGRFEVHTLTVNYRTTAEILESTRDLLAEIAPEQSLSRSLRHGEPPRVRKVPRTMLTAAIEEELSTAGGGLTAVIGPDDCDKARGLEFDFVVVVDPHRMHPRDRYVALTRATRRLTILEVTP